MRERVRCYRPLTNGGAEQVFKADVAVHFPAHTVSDGVDDLCPVL
jgi:hypothetical protein